MAPTLPANFVPALRILSQRLEGLLWAVTGSTGMVLQGVPLTPADIDLQTVGAHAYEIERRFRGAFRRPVRLRTSGRLRSHFGVLQLQGVTVEIIGDLQKRLPDGSWSSPPDLEEHRRFVLMEGISLPVLDLSYEAEAYAQLGRETRARTIRRWLEEGTSPA